MDEEGAGTSTTNGEPQASHVKNGLVTMNAAPITSLGLLRSIREDRLSIRWNDFVQRYSPMMRAFLHQHFPILDS